MGFQHVRVSDVAEFTHRLVTDLELRGRLGYVPMSDTQKQQLPPDIANNLSTILQGKPFTWYEDTIPMHTQLASFCDAVRAALPGVRVGVKGDMSVTKYGADLTSEADGYRVTFRAFRQVYVYYPNDLYVMGSIGRGDFSTNSSGERKFMVASRHIENAKVRDHRPQYHMATSEKVAGIMPKVKKYLRRYTPQDVMKVTYQAFRALASESATKASNLRSNTFGNIRTSDKLRDEIRHLANIGHVFASPEFGQLVAEFMTAEREAAEHAAREVHGYHVLVTEQFGEQYLTITEVFDVKATLYDPKAGTSNKLRIQDVPDDIMGKLSVLSILEPQHFVDGVGMRLDANEYWMVRDV